MLYTEGLSHSEGGIIAANVFGVIGYTTAAALLYASAIATFDIFSGRTECTPPSAYMHPGNFYREGTSPFMETGGEDATVDITMAEIVDMVEAAEHRQLPR